MAKHHFPGWLVAVLLGFGTIAVYWPATGYDFVGYDDGVHVTSNLPVQRGLTPASIKWALCNPVNCMWHPLTVWSHMLDCQLFGLQPWGHHLTSVLLHALNTAWVFLLLRRLTGSLWRSLLVAALFGVHPLRVESVAWVAERKDVLSGFFFLLTLLAYARYVECRVRPTDDGPRTTENGGPSCVISSPWSVVSSPSSIFYFLSLLFFALGLMSKPMLVTLPFVLLLLDYWPLARMRNAECGVRNPDLTHHTPRTTPPACGLQPSPRKFHPSSFILHPLLLEKLPFFLLSAGSCVLTFMVQRAEGALGGNESLSLSARGGNALISCWRYAGKLLWPTHLAAFYPHPGRWPLELVLLAGGLLLAVSALFLRQRRRRPFLLMGWLWFLGTLVPAIQLVQTGSHAMADRYTYIPSLGVLILTIWGVNDLTRRSGHLRIAFWAAASAVIVLCLALTRQQLGHWRNSETLFRHALAVTENNVPAHNNLGMALEEKGQVDEAMRHYQEAIRQNPNYVDAHYNLGNVFLKKGQVAEAIPQFKEVTRLKPDDAEAHNHLGHALGRQGQLDAAIRHFQTALHLRPDYADACYGLGLALAHKGQMDEAMRQYQQAIRLQPDAAGGYDKLRLLLAEYPKALAAIATTLDGQGKYAEAIRLYRVGLAAQPDQIDILNNPAWLLATCPEAAYRDGPEAVRLATRACELSDYSKPLLIGTLAAAQAEAGDFAAAVATAERAAALATSLGLEDIAARNRELLKLYKAGEPFHETPR